MPPVWRQRSVPWRAYDVTTRRRVISMTSRVAATRSLPRTVNDVNARTTSRVVVLGKKIPKRKRSFIYPTGLIPSFYFRRISAACWHSDSTRCPVRCKRGNFDRFATCRRWTDVCARNNGSSTGPWSSSDLGKAKFRFPTNDSHDFR